MSTAMAHTSPDRTSAATTPQAQQQQQHGVTTTTTTAATRTTCGVVMPREVVAWLQTLQLSRAIRHPRRDLADGCLVAEVCARYWHDVPLHAFERKTSVQQKLSNWTVLRRVFARHETELGERVITGMVQSTPHYAEAFLLQLYTLLTGRRVHIAAPLPCGAEEVAMPPYNPRAYASTTPALQLAQTHTTMPTRQREAQQQQHASSSPHCGDGVVTAAMATLLLGSNGNNNTITMPHEHTVATPSRAMHAMQPVASNTTAAVAQQQQQQQQPRRASLASSHEPPVRLSVVAVKAIDRTASTTRQQPQPQPQPLQSRTAADEHDSASPTWCVAWLDDLLQSQLPSCRAWPVAHDAAMTATPPAPATAVVIARTAPVLAYFLQHEDALDAAVQNAVWGVLLSRVDVLVRHVQRTPLALTTLTQWFALPHVRAATATTTAAAVDNETTYNNNNDDDDDNVDVRHASARAIAFLATVVTQWCDVDAHAAFAAFVRNVLAVPALRARLRRLDAASADVYASLLCAVVPRDRSLTQTMLPPLLSAVGEAVLQRPCCCSSSVDDDGAAVAAAVLCARSDAAAVSFLVLLRVWALQLLRALPPRGRSTPAAMTATTTTTTTTAAAATSSSLSPPPSSSLPSSSTSGARVVSSASTTSMAIDGAMAALYRTVAQCAQAALSSPSSSLRLLGAALAVTLTRHEWPAAVATTTTTATTAYAAAMTTAAADDNDDDDDDDATALQRLLFPARTRVQRGGSRAHATASLSLQVLPTDEPWLHVQRAIWLRRQYEHMAAAATTTTAVASPHTFRLSAAATMVSARARATRRHVAAATRSLCALLRRRGVVAPCAKAVMAYEMASLLPSLHACCCNHNNNKSSRSSCHVTRQQQQQPQASTPAGDDDDDDVDNTLAHDVACAVMTYYVYEASDDVVACAFATRTATARSGSRNNGSSSGGPVATHATNTATPQQQQQSQQQYHHLLGGYDVCAVMRHSSALLLTAAMLDVLPPTSHDDRNDAVRRLHARAALLARDRVPSPALQQRIEWLYRLHCSADDNDDDDGSGSRRVVVGGGGSRVRALLSRSPHNSHSGGGSYAHASGATRDGDASAYAAAQQQHWHALLRALYPDVALVTMAAEMAMRMHGGGNSSNNNNSSSHARASVDARMAVLLTLAGKAQHVVQRWYAQRATAAVRNSNSIAATDAAHDNDDNAAAAASEHEAMTRAMTWYHEHYKAVDV